MQFSRRAMYLTRNDEAIEDHCTGRWLGCAAPQAYLLTRARIQVTFNNL
jgi:hypothetical protein